MVIVTLAYNRPDFIELQLNSIKKWVKDFKYIVFDNCPDDSIKNECERLGVICVPIKIFNEDPSWCVGLSLNKMWEILRYEKGELLYLDSDMFLVGELPEFNCDMAFVPQKKGKYYYPWTGLMYFNMDTLPRPGELKWNVDYSLKDTDVGGLNHFYLKEYKPKVRKIQMWTLIDEGKYSFNGTDTEADRSWGQMEKLARKYDMPRPYSFDVFIFEDNTFVFHYKSASNYPDFYTEEYNKLKTKSLCELLTS